MMYKSGSAYGVDDVVVMVQVGYARIAFTCRLGSFIQRFECSSGNLDLHVKH